VKPPGPNRCIVRYNHAMLESANNARRTRAALRVMYQFLLWLVPAVDKSPHSQKFILGDRIETAAPDVLDALIAAT
jgi:hypothetical protein